MILFPRFHLFEIEDQDWCPSWLILFIQTYLTALWDLRIPFVRNTAAEVAASIIKESLPKASSYTFVDTCARAGGPIPAIETALNAKLFLADRRPCMIEWKAIKKQHECISFIPEPVDATSLERITSEGRECRIFNISFRHFDDDAAKLVLSSVMQSADSFIIFEFLQRDFTTFLFCCLTTVSIPPFVHILLRFRRSLVHIIFTFMIWVAPAALAIDGFMSMLRTRTHTEIKDLTWKPEHVSDEWVFKHGSPVIFGPWHLHWHMGYRPIER
ncbi:hypothetical protein BDV23DRAFT_193952 [Aspergillus alliaceus]|uniref:Methyltransferase domain-containing protein n=1 Tax=Petromyces alliaceus TaxID=209559 RepID=A0A5N7C8S0_PETAA|nr:hypothetical protein BDV23DRAFT_193952 [Aspergillus alliaceus]